MENNKKRIYAIVSVIISSFIFLSGCNLSNVQKSSKMQSGKASEGTSIPEEFKQKHVDTKLCRLYYNQDDGFVMNNAEKFTKIYQEVCDKFKHMPKVNPEDSGLIAFYFLDSKTYEDFTDDKNGGACWKRENAWNAGFINLDRKDAISDGTTFRHELIHAVTLSSGDLRLQNYPGWFIDGVAMYYQSDIIKGNGSRFQWEIRKAIAEDKIVPWEIIVPSSGSWGGENRVVKYIQSAYIYEYLTRTYGEERINNIFYTQGDFYDILMDITRKSVDKLEKDWFCDLKDRFQ